MNKKFNENILKAMEGALEVAILDPTQRELRPAMRADVEGSTDLAAVTAPVTSS